MPRAARRFLRSLENPTDEAFIPREWRGVPPFATCVPIVWDVILREVCFDCEALKPFFLPNIAMGA